jgi:hypothetical protein
MGKAGTIELQTQLHHRWNYSSGQYVELPTFCPLGMAAICAFRPLPAHRTAGAAHTGGREVGSFEMAAGVRS